MTKKTLIRATLLNVFSLLDLHVSLDVRSHRRKNDFFLLLAVQLCHQFNLSLHTYVRSQRAYRIRTIFLSPLLHLRSSHRFKFVCSDID